MILPTATVIQHFSSRRYCLHRLMGADYCLKHTYSSLGRLLTAKTISNALDFVCRKVEIGAPFTS